MAFGRDRVGERKSGNEATARSLTVSNRLAYSRASGYTRAYVQHRARKSRARAGVFLSHWDFARDCLSRSIHRNTSAHTPPAYGTCRATRAAYLAAHEMLTRHKQHVDRVCIANLTDQRVTLRGGCLSLPRHARSLPRRLLPGSGFFARGLHVASAHVVLEIAEVSACLGLLTCPDRIPSSRTDLLHPFGTAHMYAAFEPAAYDTCTLLHAYAAHVTSAPDA